MLFTFPFRSFLYLFVVLFSSVLDKDPSGLKVLANKTNSEVSKPLVAVEKSHHHHDLILGIDLRPRVSQDLIGLRRLWVRFDFFPDLSPSLLCRGGFDGVRRRLIQSVSPHWMKGFSSLNCDNPLIGDMLI